MSDLARIKDLERRVEELEKALTRQQTGALAPKTHEKYACYEYPPAHPRRWYYDPK